MAKFLFIYRESTESRAKPSPEEMQALQQAWYAWMQKFQQAEKKLEIAPVPLF